MLRRADLPLLQMSTKYTKSASVLKFHMVSIGLDHVIPSRHSLTHLLARLPMETWLGAAAGRFSVLYLILTRRGLFITNRFPWISSGDLPQHETRS